MQKLSYTVEGKIETTILNKIVSSVNFWNTEGKEIIEKNKKGFLGDFDTQLFCSNNNYKDVILQFIMQDIKILTSSSQLKTGKGGNHVWIYDPNKDKRIMILNF